MGLRAPHRLPNPVLPPLTHEACLTLESAISIQSLIHHHETLAWTIGILSAATFSIGLVIVPLLIIRLPPDYFDRGKRSEHRPSPRHPAVRILVLVLKNSLGGVLVAAGFIMILLPGQGILTMLIGLTLIDFPNKFQWEKRMVGIPAVLCSINWIRAQAGRQPIPPPPREEQRGLSPGS